MLDLLVKSVETVETVEIDDTVQMVETVETVLTDYLKKVPDLGKPSRKKSAVFLNIVQTGEGGSNPCSKTML